MIDGVDYKSEHAAIKVLGIGVRELRNRLQSPDFPEYVSKYRKKEYGNKKMRQKKNPCTIAGVHYESEFAAAKALGIGTSVAVFRLKSSNYPDYISKYHPKEGRRIFTPCSVAGVEYRSIGLAAKELGIPSHEMKRRLISIYYPDYL